MKAMNEMSVSFPSVSSNEGFARAAVSAFAAQLDPTLDQLADLKTAVSEAVTNAIIHGYGEQAGKIRIHCRTKGQEIYIDVCDEGAGIADVKKAMEPLFTTRPELERSGMGFAFMEAFMDELSVDSALGKGTRVHMKKVIGEGRKAWSTQSL